MAKYRHKFIINYAIIFFLIFLTTISSVKAGPLSEELQVGLPSTLAICEDQTYALCAASSCYVYNQVAYCKCDVKTGDSISLAFDVDGEDVCDVNANGPANGYMVSTFSVPDSVLAGSGSEPGGDMALYTCPADTSDGAYGQCDGGICFIGTQGVPSFPGFDEPVGAGEIICSCPITEQKPNSPGYGYQIAGPFPCQESYFDNCRRENTNTKTGTHIPVGAPTGSARILALLLNGGPPLPRLNKCEPSPHVEIGSEHEPPASGPRRHHKRRHHRD